MSQRTGKEISYHIRGLLTEGKLEEFDKLRDEMVAATYADAGSVDYLWYISDDKKEVHFYERYKDADACLEHGATFAKFGERFMSCITWDAFWVFGDLDKDPESAGGKFRAILEPMKAQFFGKFGSGGFSK